MPKLPVISSNKMIKIASKKGFNFVRQSGSHIILKNSEEKLLVIPNHKKLKKGTLIQIIKILEINKEEVLK